MKTVVQSNWSDAVLVCGKCSRKLNGGFGPKSKTGLAKALRRHLGLSRGRKALAGVVEVKCLGVCPKGAVTVIDTAHPRQWLLVPEHADLDDVAETLGLTRA